MHTPSVGPHKTVAALCLLPENGHSVNIILPSVCLRDYLSAFMSLKVLAFRKAIPTAVATFAA